MHACFSLFGKLQYVRELEKWLETRKVLIPVKNPKGNSTFKDKKGKVLKEGFLPLEAVLRQGFLGTYELIFPEFEKDRILTMLKFGGKAHNRSFTQKKAFQKFKLKAKFKTFEKALGLKPVPKFEEDPVYMLPEHIWEHVTIVPHGVRYDKKDHEFPNGLIHEAL